MDLDDWRSRINDLDEQILNLLNQRGHAALQIGDLKRQQDSAVLCPGARGPGPRAPRRAESGPPER